jgi:hypothetical protein
LSWHSSYRVYTTFMALIGMRGGFSSFQRHIFEKRRKSNSTVYRHYNCCKVSALAVCEINEMTKQYIIFLHCLFCFVAILLIVLKLYGFFYYCWSKSDFKKIWKRGDPRKHRKQQYDMKFSDSVWLILYLKRNIFHVL